MDVRLASAYPETGAERGSSKCLRFCLLTSRARLTRGRTFLVVYLDMFY